MAKMNDVAASELPNGYDLAGDPTVKGAGAWEVIEGRHQFGDNSKFVSTTLTIRARLLQGYLIRTFYQFYDGQTMHVTMSQTYVPDPNEQWSVTDVKPTKTNKEELVGALSGMAGIL